MLDEPDVEVRLRSARKAPEEVLFPRDTWNDQSAYDAQALKLAAMFRENFRKFADEVSSQILNAAPKG